MGDFSRIIEGLTKAAGFLPSLVNAATPHVPPELSDEWRALTEPALTATAPESVREAAAVALIGTLKAFKDGHGETGKHSVHAG
jgi:hypothetical protein